MTETEPREFALAGRLFDELLVVHDHFWSTMRPVSSPSTVSTR